MALSGSTSVTVTSWDTLTFSWSATQSVANNTSTVSWQLKLVAGTYGYISSSASKDWSVTVNGTNYSGTNTIGIGNNSTKVLASGSTVVSHNSDGTKSFSYSFSQEFGITFSGSSIGTKSGSGSGTLNTIPRASTMSVPTITIGSAGTLSISRASSSFTHTITATFGSYSTTIANKTSATSVNFTPPLTWCNAVPSATSGTATYVITTYSGSTNVGSKTYSAKLNVPSSVIPSVSKIAHAEAVSGIASQFDAYLMGKSRVKFTITSAGSYGSTIKSIVTSFNGQSLSGASPTSALLASSGTLKATVTVTDSRGRKATGTTNISVTKYTEPVINVLSVIRANNDGTPNDEGESLFIAYGFTIDSVSNKNTKSYTLSIKANDETSFTTLATGGVYTLNTSLIVSENISTEKSYTIRLTVKDYFRTITYDTEAPTAFTLMDFHSSGKGMAIGKVAQKEGVVEMGLPVEFTNGETPNGAITVKVNEDLDNLLDPGFYLFSSATSSTLKNSPFENAGSGAIEVIREGEANQVRQVLTRCSVNREIWERVYYSDTWFDWQVVFRGGDRVLWSGSYYMTANQTANLSQKISKQEKGIVLVFSRYSGGEMRNYHFNSFFVSKEFIALLPGMGNTFLMTTDGSFSVMATKYLYIHDDKIVGNDINTQTGTGASGVTYENNGFVLRYVIGV